MQIILIGYRCTGKSSVGRQLAEKLDLTFYDTDQMITAHIGKSIRELVAEKGWAAFRREEKNIIDKIAFWGPAVIALGGGAILDPENRATIRASGTVIWLSAGLETILKRMSSDSLNADNRPSLTDKSWHEEVRETLEQRISIYRDLALMQVDTEGKSIEEISSEIVSKMNP
ncbi:MAG TPA: shikimate kinase [Thermodesulfobacteriota bacterium]|nr:shikimate kinase [Thermodesulfobacteriota bacterium]